MVKFNDPFQVTVTPDLCDNGTCAPCIETPSVDDCFICGYPSGIIDTCLSNPTPCLDGAVSCLDCETVFENLDIQFLGGFVSGFSSKLGLGASESTTNIDIVVPKYKCPDPTTTGTIGVCCEPDGSCSTLYANSEECVAAGGSWKAGQTCDDNPCCSGCSQQDAKYEGKLGYIYTFNMAAFCFRGILSNHNYTEDSSGYKYRITLTDGRNILNNTAVLLNGAYTNLPPSFKGSVINVTSAEQSVSENDCGSGKQCRDFMTTGSNSTKGVKLKSALEAINGKCISIPVSNAGLTINVSKLINVVSDKLRTTNTESTILELITLAAEESGYDFLVTINNNNEFEILPINYKHPATEKSLFNFIEDLAAQDIVISKDYGEEMAGTSSKNKRIVFGNNLSYITRVRDYQVQQDCSATYPALGGICCDADGICSSVDNEGECVNGGTWYPFSVCEDEPCAMQAPCSIKNNPASIGAYDSFYITPTPAPTGCQ